ncbi:phosphatase PAP2 family protein [Fictibacillus iocasae]|uniref:Phosphatase PAP2 family protein n=1 Tax=Fictibacillus iocasae TaxID=2715437 RepID=A0ABW2NQQ8_9BACL
MFKQLFKKIPFPITPVLIVLIGFLSALGSLKLFLELAEEVREQEVLAFDQQIIQWVNGIREPVLNHIMVLITELGSKTALALLLIASLIWLAVKRKNYYAMIMFLVASAGGGLLNLALKHWFERQRPEESIIEALGYSFPSGHAMGSLIYYGFLGYLVVKSQRSHQEKTLWTILFSILILFIGFSRVYLGVHYPSDIIAGYSAGLLWLFVCITALEGLYFYNKRRSRR